MFEDQRELKEKQETQENSQFRKKGKEGRKEGMKRGKKKGIPFPDGGEKIVVSQTSPLEIFCPLR